MISATLSSASAMYATMFNVIASRYAVVGMRIAKFRPLVIILLNNVRRNKKKLLTRDTIFGYELAVVQNIYGNKLLYYKWINDQVR